jgi:soluble lytic murein transglycosylase-like protein
MLSLDRSLTFILCLLSVGSALAISSYPVHPVHSSYWTDEYDRHFKKYSKRYFGPMFDWNWFKAQAIAESGLNEKAKSPAGAIGVMQILPSTFEEISDKQPHYIEVDSARWNIAAGIYYDRSLYTKFPRAPEQERLYLAMASYNAGYGRVLNAFKRAGEKSDWDSVQTHLPSETRAYVSRIRRLMGNK